jgi:hypothetical protein
MEARYAMRRHKTKEEKAYHDKLAAMGCAICVRLGFDGSQAQIHHVRKHGGRRDLQEMNVIPLCPTHHSELHANRRNYGALYGIEEQALADEMRTRFMPMLRQSTESRLHGRLRSVQSAMDSQTAGGAA